MIKTATWDVVAWNRAAALILTDYATLPPEQRNILRLMFLTPKVRYAQADWESVARLVVGAFRADAARIGPNPEVDRLVPELTALSTEFERLWKDNQVNAHGEGRKRIHHPELGLLELEYSGFAVDTRPDLAMVVFNPVHNEDVERIRSLLRDQEGLPSA